MQQEAREGHPVAISIPNPYRGVHGLSSNIWIICATTFVNRTGLMALPFLVLYLTKQLGTSVALAGLAVSLYGVGGIIATPIAGRIADRVGPFLVMRGALAMTGALLIALSLVRNVALLMVLTCLWGALAESERPATTSWLSAATSPRQRRAAMALHRLAINLGMSIGPAIGGFLAIVSFPLVFIVDGITSLVAATMLTILFSARRFATPTHGRASAGLNRQSATVWRDGSARLFFALFLLVSIVFAQHQGAMALYLVRDLHYRETFYGGLFVLNTLLVVALEVPLNSAMSHWQTRTVIALSASLVAVGFGALAVATRTVPIMVSVVIWTFGEMTFFPTAISFVAELAPLGRTGEYMGAFWSTFSLAFVVGPWAGAALLDHFGPRTMWSVTLVCGLAAAMLARFLDARAPSLQVEAS
jgi:predicted MFS family arabinose efflux permease